MKKILILLALLVAMTLVFVSCQDEKPPVDDTTVADQPTEEPTQGEEDPTQAPDTDPETPEPGTDEPDEPTTPAPDTDEPDTPAPDTDEPETPEPETKDPMEPVNVFGAEDIQTVTGGDPNNMTQDCLTLEDGYIHVVPIGPDPYWYPFAGVDGARYVAIRYRTDATGADIQMYIGSTGGGPNDDSTMLRQPVVADSEWHVAIFDTQSLIDAGKYDGKYVSYFRFDALEAGYILDENGQPYKPDGTNYARYTLPEGCSIDVAYIGFFHSEEAIAKYDFEQYPPFSQPSDAGMKNNSFDTFYVNGQMYFPEDGNAGGKLDEINNTLTFASAAELQSITLRGWIGFDQAMDSFGYYVDNYEFVYGEFKTATEDGVLGAGGEFASRFEIKVPLEYLEGDDHFVGFVVKLADGTVVQLRAEITIDLPELPKDITDSFVSDVNANEIGTTMDASDLANFFVTELPLPGSGVEANGEGKLYHLTSINDMYADVNGRYFIKANVIDSNAAGWMFARGYKVVNSDEIVEKFDPAGGFYMINNYYETDSAGAMGGAGIYARLQGGKLFLMIKYYNPESITRVGNKMLFIDAAGSELTLADNGSKVSVLVDGVTYATIELSGSIAYGDINEVQPAGEFAEKAVITLKDGTTETIENTLIAATCQCQVGFVARAGSFKFDSVAVGGYSAIEVPALEVVTPEEPEPVDPDAPVLVLTPEFINGQALSTGGQTITQHIATSEVKTEDEITFVRLTVNGGDPYVALVNIGSMLELPPYMAFSYRTNCGLDAHVFIGSGAGWNGNGDVTPVAWNEDQQWNHAILDLANCGLTSIQNNLINYCRFDFFTGQGVEGDYMDVEYVAFFNSAEAAEKYYNNLHKADEPEVPETPEMPSEFILSLYQGNTQKTLYFNGQMSGNFLAMSTNIVDAVKMYSEKVEGGYRMYFLVDDAKNYVEIYEYQTGKKGVHITTEPAPTFYQWSEDANTWITWLEGCNDYAYLGTYNTFETISSSWISFITGDNAANVGVSQFLAQWADVPPPHEHTYDEGVVTDPTCTENGYTTYTCACGHSYTDNVVEATGHNYVDGTCGICGEKDPDYVDPDAPVVLGGSADFNTIVTPNTNGDSSYKNTYTTENGWTSTNSAIQAGGASVSNPQFPVIGPDNTYKAICMNGKVGAAGTITSPTLSGGISKLVLTYTKMFTDTKLSVTITVTDLATGATYTRTVARDVDKDADKFVVWTDEWVLETPITGDFTIEIVNDCPSQSTSNKDRFTVLSVDWEGAEADEPETPDEPTANEIQVTTTDTYGWFDEYTFVADAAGNYTFTLPAGLGMWSIASYNSWGNPELDYNFAPDGGDVTVALAADEEFKFLVGAFTKGDWTITYTFTEGEVGGGDEPDPEDPVVEQITLVVGQNNVEVTEAILANQGVDAILVIETEGNYTFRGDFFAQIYNELGMMVGTGTAYLTPGTYTVKLGTFLLSGAGTYGLVVELETPEEPEIPEEPDVPTGDPDGTQANPYVITSLPLTINGTGIHDLYYSYTATDVVKLEITYTEGGLITLGGEYMDWDKDEAAMKYIVVVDAGQTLILNPWGNVDATYVVSGGGKK
ncbi:MAG: hypothetical protein J6M42_06410 [Clostridia bacterium]|nr:hypothetical protein [Clostridia bacterium]